VCAATGWAADWSTTELHLQYGTLDIPYSGGADEDTLVMTWQHASGWKYGDNFFFVDWTVPDNDIADAYGEWYSNLSLEKIFGKDISVGPLTDIGIIGGLNMGADPNVLIYLPGIRLSWDLPGFAFANTDFTAYLVDNPGVDAGDLTSDPPDLGDPNAAPDTDDGFMIDFNFATKQMEIGPTKWNIEGHIEYISARDTEFGTEEEEWVLAQPQVRCDISPLLALPENTLFAGIEYQYWMNKLGDDETDENVVQALLVWRL
jgi:hypothetical protein